MERRDPPVDPAAEGRLRELASKWFIDTQVPLIVHNGFFPAWFLGFITRKDAEEILREKELGCFLIRLSDRAIGYILSYKGRDRCRHFVINQSESGQFAVCGDTEEHDTVCGLIEYYQASPIQPFGEYLTSSCFEALNEELYDMVCPKERPAAPDRLPTRPPKCKTEEAPPVPRRSRHLDAGLLSDQDRVLYAQLRKHSPRERQRKPRHKRPDSPRGGPGGAESSPPQDHNTRRCSPPPPGPDQSTTFLHTSSDRLSAAPHTPPRLSPRPVRQALEHMSAGAVYHLAGRPGSPHAAASEQPQRRSVYAEVSSEPLAGHFPYVSTYELIPDQEDTNEASGNTYEPLEDIRPKQNHSSWGLKSDKWKWLFPEVKRKW